MKTKKISRASVTYVDQYQKSNVHLAGISEGDDRRGKKKYLKK